MKRVEILREWEEKSRNIKRERKKSRNVERWGKSRNIKGGKKWIY